MSWKNNKQGITLLLALLIMAVLLTVALSVADLATKEFELSSLGRESQSAFYAAETGYDCANYWQKTCKAFSTTSVTTTSKCPTTPGLTVANPAGGVNVSCNGVPQGSYNRTVTQSVYNTDPPGPELHTPAINLPNYNGQPVRAVVELPGASSAVTIQVTAENTTVSSAGRKVQRTFMGITNACFANADVMLVIDRSAHVCGGFNAEDYIYPPTSCPELESAKIAIKDFINALAPTAGGTHVGMISFGYDISYPGGPDVVHTAANNPPPPGGDNHLPPVGPPPAEERHHAAAALGSGIPTLGVEIDQMLGGGKPNTPDALAAAVDEFNANGRPGVPRFIVLITNGNPFVPSFHIPPSGTSALCLGAAGHVHDGTVGGNDDNVTTPPSCSPLTCPRPLSRSESVLVANYAKGIDQCSGSFISAPVTIYTVGVGPNVNDGFVESLASSPTSEHYYTAADYAVLQTTLVNEVAACQ